MKKKIGVLINFGPEIRPFFENKLSTLFTDEYEIIYIIKNTNCISLLNKKITDKSVIFEKNKIVNNSTLKFRLFARFEKIFLLQRQSRQRKNKIGNYHFTSGSNYNIKYYDFVFGLESIYNICRKTYTLFAEKIYYSLYISNLFKKHKITDLLYYGSNIYEVRSFIYTAKKDEISLWRYVGNWKDIYIDDFVPVQPNKLFVWSEKMKSELLVFNKHILEKSVVISGNLFFHHFHNYKTKNNYEFYKKKYQIKENSNIFLWPLSMKSVFPNEHILIKKIDDYIESNFIVNKPIIVIRDNPFGAASENVQYYNKLKNIRIAENFWQINKIEDFTFQTSEGEAEWADLLHYSKAIISTPSTVTLESILFKKTSINILFDENGSYSDSIASFSNAPFYSEMLNRNDICVCENLNDFYNNFDKLNKIKQFYISQIQYPAIIDGNLDYSLNKFIKALTE
jgi:hypothetical protein